SKRRSSRKVAIGKGVVDNHHLRFRAPVGYIEEAPFTQLRANGGKVIAGDKPYQRNLPGHLVLCLTSELIKRRVGVVWRQWKLRSRPGAHHTRYCTNPFQLRIDEGHTFLEILVTKQWGFKGQQLFHPNP